MGNKLVTAFHNDKTDRRPAFPQDDLACPEDTHTFFPRQPAPALSPAGFARQDGFAPQPLSPRALRCLSQPTQCQTLRSGQGDAAPPLNPQLPAPLPGQRAVGAAVANRVAGAIPADRLSGARASFGIEGAEPLASPFVGTKGRLAYAP